MNAVINPEACWDRVRRRLSAEFGETAYRNWLRKLSFIRVDDARAILAAPTPFMRDQMYRQFGPRLVDAWRQVTEGAVTELDIEIATSDSIAPPSDAEPEHTEAGIESAQRSDAVFSPLDPRYTFENFVVGRPNEFAYSAARRVAEENTVSYNPLFLCGGVGLGKTHLMHAMAAEIWRRTPDRKVVYLSAEQFMYRFIRALRSKDTVGFKDQFRSINVLIVDDIQFMGHKDATQEEFFHTLNALVEQNRQIVVSADRTPNDIDGLHERLRSRLGCGLVADIHPTTYELRLGIVQSKVETLDVHFPTTVMEFLAQRITSNVRELEGAINRVAAHATLVGRPVTLDSVNEVLADLLRHTDRPVTIAEIQKHIADHFQIRESELLSARKDRSIVRPRQIAMFLAKRITTMSLPEIGKSFGGRDHTTVIHAVKRVQELRTSNPEFNDVVTYLESLFSSRVR